MALTLNKPPAFQFYVKEWMSSTAHLSAFAKGVYIDLMAWSWDNGPLPVSERARATIASQSIGAFRRAWAELGDKWIDFQGQGFINRRLEQQRDALHEFRQKQSERGKLGGAGKHKATRNKATAYPDVNSSSAVCDLQSEDQELKIVSLATSAKPADTSPVFMTFPTVGTNGRLWGLSQSQIADWATTFPNLDVSGECRKALAWVQANPGKRKTARGMPAFLVRWLSRAVDQPGPLRHEAQPARAGKGQQTVDAVARALARRAEGLS